MNHLETAQHELRVLKHELLSPSCTFNPFCAAALGNIHLALTHLFMAERQLAGFNRGNGDDRSDSTVDHFSNPAFSDLSSGDVT